MSALTLNVEQKSKLAAVLSKVENVVYNFKPEATFNGCTCQGNCDGRTSCGCQWG